VLDVTIKEDACSIYHGEAAHILATVRHMTQNMLRAVNKNCSLTLSPLVIYSDENKKPALGWSLDG
jgi:hypothetical protein